MSVIADSSMSPAVRRGRWAVLLFAFFNKNLGTVATYNCYGLMMPLLVNEFSAGTSQVAIGIGLISVLNGLVAPWVGRLLDKWSLTGTIILGCVSGAIGFYLASIAHSVASFVLLYGVIGGLGVTAMGNLPAMKLAALSFPNNKGQAIGFAMLPVSGVVGPLLCAPLLAVAGWRGLLQVFAVSLLLIAALTPWFIGLLKRGSTDAQPAAAAASTATVNNAVLDRWAFGYLVVASGILMSSGIVMVTHLVSYTNQLHVSSAMAATMLACVGGIASPGAYVFAWLADKFKPAGMIALNAALQMLIWAGLATAPSLPVLWLLVLAQGFCIGGPYPAVTVFVSKLYPQARFGSMMGRVALAVVPFSFAMPPVTGWLADIAGNYRNSWLLEAVLCGIATVLMGLLQQRYSRESSAVTEHAA